MVKKINQFERGREYERAKDSMRFHLWLGYGSIIYLGIFVLASLFNRSIIDIWTMVVLFLFGLANLYLGYSEKKGLKLK